VKIGPVDVQITSLTGIIKKETAAEHKPAFSQKPGGLKMSDVPFLVSQASGQKNSTQAENLTPQTILHLPPESMP